MHPTPAFLSMPNVNGIITKMGRLRNDGQMPASEDSNERLRLSDMCARHTTWKVTLTSRW